MNIGTEHNGLTYIVRGNELLVLSTRNWNNVIKRVELPYTHSGDAITHANDKFIVVELKITTDKPYPNIAVYRNGEEYELINTIEYYKPWYGGNCSACTLSNDRLQIVARTRVSRDNSIMESINVENSNIITTVDIVGSTDYVSILRDKSKSYILRCDNGEYEILKYRYNGYVCKYTLDKSISDIISSMGCHRLERLDKTHIAIVNMGNTIARRLLGDIIVNINDGSTKLQHTVNSVLEPEYLIRGSNSITRHLGNGKVINNITIKKGKDEQQYMVYRQVQESNISSNGR